MKTHECIRPENLNRMEQTTKQYRRARFAPGRLKVHLLESEKNITSVSYVTMYIKSWYLPESPEHIPIFLPWTKAHNV